MQRKMSKATPLLQDGDANAEEDAPALDEKKSLVGLACVTLSSLLFGVVSALLKYVGLPTPLMMQVRDSDAAPRVVTSPCVIRRTRPDSVPQRHILPALRSGRCFSGASP